MPTSEVCQPPFSNLRCANRCGVPTAEVCQPPFFFNNLRCANLPFHLVSLKSPPGLFCGPIPFMQMGAFLPGRANLLIASIPQRWANSFYADGGIPPQQGQFVNRQHSSAMVVDIPGVLTGGPIIWLPATSANALLSFLFLPSSPSENRIKNIFIIFSPYSFSFSNAAVVDAAVRMGV